MLRCRDFGVFRLLPNNAWGVVDDLGIVFCCVFLAFHAKVYKCLIQITHISRHINVVVFYYLLKQLIELSG